MNIDQIARGYAMAAEATESILALLPPSEVQVERRRLLNRANDQIIATAINQGRSRDEAERLCAAIVKRADLLMEAKVKLATAKPAGTA